jgi:hypothetical protein
VETGLRRRQPAQQFPPLRSAEPEPLTPEQREELTLTAEQSPAEMGQWEPESIKALVVHSPLGGQAKRTSTVG